MLPDPPYEQGPFDGASNHAYPEWRRWFELDAEGLNPLGGPVGIRANWNRVELYAAPDPTSPFSKHMGDGRSDNAAAEPFPSFSALDLDDPVVTALLFKQAVTMDDVDRAWRRLREQTGADATRSLWRVLADDPNVDRDRVFAEAAAIAGYARLDVDPAAARVILFDCADLFTEDQWDRLARLRLLPLHRNIEPDTNEEKLVFASHDPSRPEVARLMRQLGLADCELRYVPRSRIESILGEDVEEADDDVDRLHSDAAEPERKEPPSVGPAAEPMPADEEDLVDRCLSAAVRQSASTVHVRPNGHGARIDFRIDGRLTPWLVVSDAPAREVIARFKEAAGLPHDSAGPAARSGETTRTIDGRQLRCVTSVLPLQGDEEPEILAVTLHEKTVGPTTLEDICIPENAVEHIRSVVDLGRGTIVVAGPAASGRSETVEAVLEEIVGREGVILSLQNGARSTSDVLALRRIEHATHEDAIDAAAGHDADVVVVGELSGRRAAERALTLAQQGRLIVAEVAAQNGVDAVDKLARMGVDPLLIAYGLSVVVSQRRMRVLCSSCRKEATHVDGEILRRLGYTPREIAEGSFHEPQDVAGCGACGGTGFDGWCTIAEAIPVSNAIRRTIALGDAEDVDDLLQIAVREGMHTAREKARELVASGQSTVEELIRVAAGVH